MGSIASQGIGERRVLEPQAHPENVMSPVCHLTSPSGGPVAPAVISGATPGVTGVIGCAGFPWATHHGAGQYWGFNVDPIRTPVRPTRWNVSAVEASKWYDDPMRVVMVIVASVVVAAFVLWGASCAVAMGALKVGAGQVDRAISQLPRFAPTLPSRAKSTSRVHYYRVTKLAGDPQACFESAGYVKSDAYMQCTASTYLACEPVDVCARQGALTSKGYRR